MSPFCLTSLPPSIDVIGSAQRHVSTFERFGKSNRVEYLKDAGLTASHIVNIEALTRSVVVIMTSSVHVIFASLSKSKNCLS
eukprot:CAMPEP_0113851342 /NCGR_PEP_ID=MMETSP0372-20130328/4567_1 /TAXON_ID=340204 /ORGANISM="Lankesteria abbotti" /LENGTH=81 /DNA_ID=CAMNT_0000822101 /DNA_START=96 /DNA_END=338 /DNA_ORIENTATION=+ /assembly_acc=CAM_ASM_000359